MTTKSKRKKRIYKLVDVDVETVGLVEEGANQQSFCLLKSVNSEEETMEDITNDGLDEKEEVTVEAVAEEIVENEGVLAKLKKALGFDDEVEEDEVEDAPQEDDVDETDVDDLRKQYDTELTELRKKADDLNKALEEAQDQGEQQRDERALHDEIEKARSYTAVSAETEEVAKMAHYLRTNDEELATWFDGFVETVNKQLEESKLFDEFGHSVIEEEPDELLEKAEKLVAEGDFENLKEALLSIDESVQKQAIAEKRMAIRQGK